MSDGAAERRTCDYCGLPVAGRLWKPSHSDASSTASFCCLGCRIAAAVVREQGEAEVPRAMLTRLGLGLFFSMSVMIFTFALWSYDVYQIDDESAASGAFVGLLRYLVLLFSLPVLLLLGVPLAENAVRNLRQGVPTTDLLLLTGVVAALAYSASSVFRGEGPVYFETACMILLFVTLGRWLEASGRVKATAALDRLEKLTPETVHRVVEGTPRDAPLAEVRCGDELEVRPGERFPCDAELRMGATSVDEHLFTGESWPVVKQPGDPVSGGTLNLDGCIRVTVTALPHEGALRRMLDAVREARGAKASYQQLADRVAKWFFPIVSIVAVATLGLHAAAGDWQRGLLAALSVVLIACPCALGIATPLAMWVALARAAERQVLFRSGAVLEQLADVSVFCFDKTGTLTSGTASVSRIEIEPDTPRQEVLARAGVLAGSTNHPLGQAVSNVVESVGTPPETLRPRTVQGRGVSGQWPGESDATLLGSHQFLVEETGWYVPTSLDRVIDEALTDGDPLTLVGWDGLVRGVFVFREELRPEAAIAVDALHGLGQECVILTGDHAARGQVLADELGVRVEAGLLPQQKVEQVRQIGGEYGRVAMVGDGINDVAGLEAADVGIAMGCGADVTRDAAAMCLLTNDLTRLPWSIELARRTVATVRNNLVWAFGYNSIGVVVAACGWLHPALAAVLMLVSSVAVTANSLRLRSCGIDEFQRPIDSDDSRGRSERDRTTSTSRGSLQEVEL